MDGEQDETARIVSFLREHDRSEDDEKCESINADDHGEKIRIKTGSRSDPGEAEVEVLAAVVFDSSPDDCEYERGVLDSRKSGERSEESGEECEDEPESWGESPEKLNKAKGEFPLR